MSGEPNFLSITTLRPRGPSVTLTVSARWLTPRSSARRALSSNSNIFAMYGSFHDNAPSTRNRAPGALSVACPWLVSGLICGLQTRLDRAIAGRRPRRLLLLAGYFSSPATSPRRLLLLAGYFSMIASTSRADRIRYSSPAYLTSVPPYLL